MEMKFIEAGQVSLAYLEKNPQFEKTVYFIHGNSGSCRTWRKKNKKRQGRVF